MKKEDAGLILLVVLFIALIIFGVFHQDIFKGSEGQKSAEEINEEICNLNPDDPACSNQTATNSKSIEEINKEICSLNPNDPGCL